MGVVRHPGSIGVRRGPDRSVGGMRRQGPVDRFDEAVGEDLSLAEKPSNWPLSDAEWDRRAGVTSFGDSGTSQRATPMSAGYVPGWGTDFAATSAGEILGAGSLPGAQRALAEWAASQLPAPTPFSPARTQQSEIADVFEQAIDLMRPLALHDLGVGRDSGQGAALLPFPALGWVDDVARGGKKGVGWLRRLLGGGDEVVDSGRAVGRAADQRPVVRMNPRNGDDWVEARRLNVQPSDDAAFYFRTQEPPLGNLRITPSEVPKGSRYYKDPEGLVARYKTEHTASQTLKPDQWGWMDPTDYRFLDEGAADLVRRHRMGQAKAEFKWVGNELRVVDAASGLPVGVVSDVPRVGSYPFGVDNAGRNHLGDRIVELGKGV